MTTSVRDFIVDWLALALAALLALALAGGVGLLIAIRATRSNEAVDARLRMVESKVGDIAFYYRCDECQAIFITDQHVGENTCRACGTKRKFCIVGVHDPDEVRGYTAKH